MKHHRILQALFLMGAGFSGLNAEEPVTKWDVGIPAPVTDAAPPEPTVKPEPIDFEVLSTRTTRKNVLEAPEMPDLPPITGTINVTVQLVEDPELPEVEPPPFTPPPSPPDDPAAVERIAEVSDRYPGTQMVSVSATVYDRKRTLLRIFPNGKSDGSVTAWSNLDFNHFSEVTTYQVRDGVDGTMYEYFLFMGIGNTNAEEEKGIAELNGLDEETTKIPELPDLAKEGPAFVLVEGNGESSAMVTLEQIHDLYATQGAKMEEAYLAREKAQAERKAYLLANPPKPKDVRIRVWSRTSGKNQQEGAR
jgi:hypothetical protein